MLAFNQNGQPYEPLTGYPGHEQIPPDRRTIFTATELSEANMPSINWLVPGLISSGLTLLAAGPKIGKSWLALQLSIAAATGGPALGYARVEQRPVLYIALDDKGPRRLQRRLRMMGADRMPLDSLTFITEIPGAGTASEMIAEYLDQPQNARSFVILDTLGSALSAYAHRPQESSYAYDSRILGSFHDIMDSHPDASLLVVHHTRKMGAVDAVDTINGTQGISAAFDTVMVLNRPRQSHTGTLFVTSRDVPENSYAMTFDDQTGLWQLEGGSLEAAAKAVREREGSGRLGENMSRLISVVNSAANPVTASDVAGELGWDVTRVRTYLSRAVNAGQILKIGRGLYSSFETEESETHGEMPAMKRL